MRRNLSNNRLQLSALLTLLMTGVASAADPQFRWSRTVEIPERTQDELVVVSLDSDIHEHTLPNWIDIRILNAAGQPQAYLLSSQTKVENRKVPRQWAATDVNLRPGEDRLEITFRLHKDDPQPQAIVVVTPLKDFEQRVDVFAGAGAEPLVSGALIFDYSQYMDVRSLKIRLPATAAREFRLVIGVLTAEQESPLLELTQRRQDGQPVENVERTTIARRPFRMDRIDFYREDEQPIRNEAVTTTVPVQLVSQSIDAKAKESVLELSTRREPLVGLAIQTSSRNFSRAVIIEQPAEQHGSARWAPLGQGRLTHLAFQHLAREELRLEFPETRAAKIRLRIKDDDSPPLTITAIEGESVVRQIQFFAAPKEHYRLAYGDENAESLQIDQSALRAALSAGISPVEGRLGPLTPSSEPPVAKPVDWKVLLNSPAVLGSVIGLLVVVLGVLLFRTAKRIDQTVPPTGEER